MLKKIRTLINQLRIILPLVLKNFTGQYGFVVFPDGKTGWDAVTQGAIYKGAEYNVRLAHITLYHGAVRNVPGWFVAKTLWDLRGLIGSDLKHDKSIVYGSKFIFWQTEITAMLFEAHMTTLKMCKFLDRDALAAAVKEGLDLTEDQKKNLEQTGHPLTGGDFLPHITTAYCSDGIELLIDENHTKGHVATVAFCEIGEYGRVTKVVAQL